MLSKSNRCCLPQAVLTILPILDFFCCLLYLIILELLMYYLILLIELLLLYTEEERMEADDDELDLLDNEDVAKLKAVATTGQYSV